MAFSASDTTLAGNKACHSSTEKWSSATEAEAQGKTLVLISHRPTVLSAVDKVLVLREGSVQLFGNREEVFAALRQANVIATPKGSPALASVRTKE